MTVKEVASYLKVSERTILRMLKNKSIPASRVLNQWRFLKPMIDDWLITRMEMDNTNQNTLKYNEIRIPLLSDLIDNDCIIFDIKQGEKKFIIEQLAEPLIKKNIVSDKKNFIKLLLEREIMTSTGLTDGVAVPHIRNQNASQVLENKIVLGICRDGIDYDSLDGKKTNLCFLICSKSDIIHLKLLAKISLLSKKPEFINKIRKSESNEEIRDILKKFENFD